MRKKYVVDLTDDERATLRDLTKKGTTGARTISRAHILLHATDGATDQAIADALHVGRATVERTHQRFVEGNLDRALYDLPRPGARRKFDGKRRRCWSPPRVARHLSPMRGGACASARGYMRNVDWLESASLDLLIFQRIQQNHVMAAFARKFQADYASLIARTGLVMHTT